MKIKIEIDVPEYVGGTLCHECPIEKYSRLCYHGMKYCKECDLSRIEIKELEENNESKSY
jgi:hypothetical protein